MVQTTDIIILGGVAVGVYFFYQYCIVQKACGLPTGGDGGGNGGGNGGGTGCTKTCTKGYKLTSDCTCSCNPTIKGCSSTQVTVLDSNGNCICKNCQSGYRRGGNGNQCVASGGTGCSPCPLGKVRGAGCACVDQQGSSGNCGWVGNTYTWRGKACTSNTIVTTQVTNTSGNRSTGCNAAKNAWCDAHAANPSSCKSGGGYGCCAPNASYNVYGGTCRTGGKCDTYFVVNFGGVKATPVFQCSGPASACCKTAHDVWVHQYGSGYTKTSMTGRAIGNPRSMQTLTPELLIRRGRFMTSH